MKWNFKGFPRADDMGGSQNDCPFWFLNMIRHLVFRDPEEAIILTTTHIHPASSTISYTTTFF